MLIKNAYIYTMDDRGVIESGWLKTEGDKIAALGAMTDPLPYDGDVFDAEGGILLPGLIDAHTHLGMWEDAIGFEGDDGNEETDPATPHLSALDAINPLDRNFSEALDAGVTTVVTGPGSANPIGGQLIAMKTFGRRVDDMVVKNPVAIKFALGENPKTVYHGRDEAPITRMGTAAIIREQLIKAQRYLKKMDEAAEDEELDEPDFDYKCEALIPLLRREIQAHFHAHRADDIFTAIRIAKEFSLDYVIVHGTEGHLIARELHSDGARVLTGPFLCDRSKPELREQTPKAAGILDGEGIEQALITDHPVIPVQYLTLCAALACREGLDKLSALKAVTRTPAHILGLDQRIGVLAPGRDADVVIFDGDPLVLASRVKYVAVNGQRVR